MDSKILSKIKIVDVDNIFPFEWEPDNNKYSDISDLNNICHPLLATEIEDGNYLLLDNSDLYYHCIKTGIKHLPLQTNTKDEIDLLTYQIGFDAFTKEELLRLSEKNPDQIVVGERPPNSLEKYIQVNFIFSDNPVLVVWLRNSTSAGCPVPLDLIFRSILDKSDYYPIIERKHRSDALTKTKNYDVEMHLPSFTLDDFSGAALSERLFPPFLINIIPQCRIFNIDFPLSILASDISIDEKDAFLAELISLRVKTRKASFYQGQVFLLNR